MNKRELTVNAFQHAVETMAEAEATPEGSFVDSNAFESVLERQGIDTQVFAEALLEVTRRYAANGDALNPFVEGAAFATGFMYGVDFARAYDEMKERAL